MILKKLCLMLVMLTFSNSSFAQLLEMKEVLDVESNRLFHGHGITEYWGKFLQNMEDPANPKEPYHIKGEEGSACTPNPTNPLETRNTGCNEGFMCLSLRGQAPTCYRKCTEMLSESECGNYKGPGQSLCMIANGGDMRLNVPEGVFICVVRCGGQPADPKCSASEGFRAGLGMEPGKILPDKCTGECPGKWKCGRVLELDGPLRCG